MRTWIVAPNGLIEPVPAPEIFTDGIGAIAIEDENVVCYFIRDQLTIEAPHAEPQRVVVLKLIRPLSAVSVSIAQLAQCFSAPPWPRPFKPTVVG